MAAGPLGLTSGLSPLPSGDLMLMAPAVEIAATLVSAAAINAYRRSRISVFTPSIGLFSR
jgi:hypothetical protein